jgi:hypothetical protein
VLSRRLQCILIVQHSNMRKDLDRVPDPEVSPQAALECLTWSKAPRRAIPTLAAA